MILLDETDRSLEIVLGGAVAANQLPYVSSWVELKSTALVDLGSSNGTTNNTTAVTVVDSPDTDKQRQVKLLTVHNSDTAVAVLTVRYNDGGTTRILWSGTLSVGDTFQYTDGEGFRVLDTLGRTKTIQAEQPGKTRSTLNNTSDVTVVSAPASGWTREVRSLRVSNQDSVVATPILKYDDGGGADEIARQTDLAVDGTWEPIDAANSVILTSADSLKMALAGAVTSTQPDVLASWVDKQNP